MVKPILFYTPFVPLHVVSTPLGPSMSELPHDPEAAKFLLVLFADMVDRHGMTFTMCRTSCYRYERGKRRAEIWLEVSPGPMSTTPQRTVIRLSLLEIEATGQVFQPTVLPDPVLWRREVADLREARACAMTRNRLLNFFGKRRKPKEAP